MTPVSDFYCFFFKNYIKFACLVPIALEHGQDAGAVVAAEAVFHAAAVVPAEAMVAPVRALVPPADKVARWQNLISIFLGLRQGGGRGMQSKERKGRDQILQRSIVEPLLQARRAKRLQSKNLAIDIWQPCLQTLR